MRALIEEDLKDGKQRNRRRFSSEDLVGKYEGIGRAATNVEVRTRLRNKSCR